MKKSLLPLLLCVCLLLSGCGGRAEETRFARFSEFLSARDTLSFTAELRAEYEDKTLRFTLAYQKDAEGQTVQVLKPERIAGIRARLGAGSGTLEYEGLILDTGPLDPYGLTPMNALPKLVEALCTGHLDSHWSEEGHPVFRLILDDQLSVSVWFEPESMTPLYAELQSGDKVCVFCGISDWNTND